MLRNLIKTEKNNIWEQKCMQTENLIVGAQSIEAWRTISDVQNNKTNSY